MSRQRETQTTQGNGQLVKGLRRRPLTAKTRVRFPYWLLKKFLLLKTNYIYDSVGVRA